MSSHFDIRKWSFMRQVFRRFSQLPHFFSDLLPTTLCKVYQATLPSPLLLLSAPSLSFSPDGPKCIYASHVSKDVAKRFENNCYWNVLCRFYALIRFNAISTLFASLNYLLKTQFILRSGCNMTTKVKINKSLRKCHCKLFSFVRQEFNG